LSIAGKIAQETQMLKLGYKLMSEEHGPKELVKNAEAAEKAGFDFAAISDHFFPWLDEQGHSPFAWSVLGAVANATERLGLMTSVTCPTMRYHPAIIAQATATLGVLTDNRFTLGLGSGERLNEHVVGLGWPGVAERHERFAEAIDIIQGLLKDELTNYAGKYLKLDTAKLYDRPSKKPMVIIAAGGPQAAELAGEKGDGLMTTDASKEILDSYRKAGGKGPRYAEISMCAGKSEEEARKTAHKYFRWSVTGWPVQAELPDTKGFKSASEHVTPENVAEQITCGPSAERHLKAIRKYVDAGFDHIVLTQIGPEQDYFVRLFEKELAPALREKKKAA
jgi:G6PDH family F420-dependent oxidoreductase